MSPIHLPYDIYPNIVDQVSLLPNDTEGHAPGPLPSRYGYSHVASSALSALCLSDRSLGHLAARQLYAKICVRSGDAFLRLFRCLSDSNGAKIALVRRLMITPAPHHLRNAGVRAHMIDKVVEWLIKYKSCSCVALHTDFFREESSGAATAVREQFVHIGKIGELVVLPPSIEGRQNHHRGINTDFTAWAGRTHLRKLALWRVRLDTALLRALDTLPNLNHLCLIFPLPSSEECGGAVPPVQDLLQSRRYTVIRRITLAATANVSGLFHRYAATARPDLAVVQIMGVEKMALEDIGDLWEVEGVHIIPPKLPE